METVLFAHEMETASEGLNGVFWGFYPSLFVSRMAHGTWRVYYKVSVTPFEGPEEDAPYWAWWNNDHQQFRHVYYSRPMVQMCFPGVLADYEERGDGREMPVKVDIIEAIFPNEENERHDQP